MTGPKCDRKEDTTTPTPTTIKTTTPITTTTTAKTTTSTKGLMSRPKIAVNLCDDYPCRGKNEKCHRVGQGLSKKIVFFNYS